MDKGIETEHETWRERNLIKIVIIVVFVLAGLYLVTGLAALVFPGLGIPLVWVAFPVGPTGPIAQ